MAPVRDGGLEAGDHGEPGEDGADGVEPGLLRIGAGLAPGAVQVGDGAGVHVGGGTDAPGGAERESAQQHGLGGGEDLETVRGEGIEERRRIGPVAAAVLHAGNLTGILGEQALGHAERDRHHGELGDVIEEDAEPGVANALDDLREGAEEPLVAHVLVVEGREHEDAAAAALHGVCGEADGVGEGRAAGAGHHAGGVETGVDQVVQESDALVDREGVALGVGAEDGQADVIRQQPATMADEAIGVGGEVGLEGGDDGGEDAGHGMSSWHGTISECVMAR